ncbi:MAG: SIS domain-containing protein [Isosphaeraceae bacterium]
MIMDQHAKPPAATHSQRYLEQASRIALEIDHESVERIALELAALRDRGGRLFFIGVGGSAANCAHAVNDFRKLAGIECYSPCENVAELTARTNDEGWATVFDAWLRVSRASARDALFVLSVGGGDSARNVSPNIVRAVDEARRRGMSVYGVVGRADGHTALHGDVVVVVPTIDPAFVTPHSESFQAVVWHCIVCHPRLMARSNRWESLERTAARAEAEALPSDEPQAVAAR